MSSKTDAVILALTTLWQAATATTLSGVQVADGPQVNADPSTDWLFVGADGLPGGAVEVALVQQSWMAFGKVKREDGQVTCAVVSVRGDPDIPQARARAFAIVSAAEDLLRADPSLGGVVSLQTYLSSDTYIPSQTGSSAHVRVVFTVTYQAQL